MQNNTCTMYMSIQYSIIVAYDYVIMTRALTAKMAGKVYGSL